MDRGDSALTVEIKNNVSVNYKVLMEDSNSA